MDAYKVGHVVGSLSSTSINRLLAKAMWRFAPPELVLTEIPRFAAAGDSHQHRCS